METKGESSTLVSTYKNSEVPVFICGSGFLVPAQII